MTKYHPVRRFLSLAPTDRQHLLHQIKNQVIGNKTAKDHYVTNDIFEELLEVLKSNIDMESKTEAAIILNSIVCDDDEYAEIAELLGVADAVMANLFDVNGNWM